MNPLQNRNSSLALDLEEHGFRALKTQGWGTAAGLSCSNQSG